MVLIIIRANFVLLQVIASIFDLKGKLVWNICFICVFVVSGVGDEAFSGSSNYYIRTLQISFGVMDGLINNCAIYINFICRFLTSFVIIIIVIYV